MPRSQWALLGLIALGVPLSAWGALIPDNTWLQVGPVALGLPLAAWALRRWPISNASAAMFGLFVLLHLVAARWSYSYVPYQQWLRLAGLDIDHTFAFHRNMFDRLVHISFGLLMVLPVAELGMRHGGMGRSPALLLALFFVFGFSSLYEIFEWLLTMTLAPDNAAAYNGEQGDMWDSQKDMACANGAAMLAFFPARACLRHTMLQRS